MSGGAQRTACKRWSDSKPGLETTNLGTHAAIIVSNCGGGSVHALEHYGDGLSKPGIEGGKRGGGWNPMEDSTER